MGGNSLIQNVPAPLGTHRASVTPTDNLAAVNVNYRRHIHITPLHPDVGDIRTPDLVSMSNLNLFQHEGLDKLSENLFSQVLSPVDHMSAHDPEKTPDALGAYYKPIAVNMYTIEFTPTVECLVR